MIKFQKLNPADKAAYDAYLLNCGQRGCEYNFANLYLWGRQRAAFLEGIRVGVSLMTELK